MYQGELGFFQRGGSKPLKKKDAPAEPPNLNEYYRHFVVQVIKLPCVLFFNLPLCVIITRSSDLVPRVLRLFGQRLIARRDSGEFKKINCF